MSEGNEREFGGAAPDAELDTQNMQDTQDMPDTEDAQDAPEARPGEDGARTAPPQGKKSKKKRKKRARRAAAVALAVAVVVLVAVIAVMVGYGIGRSRGAQLEPGNLNVVDLGSVEEVPAYDAFTEALTGDNQEALNALAGAQAPMDEEASALLGEDEFFIDAGEDGEDGEDGQAEPVVVAEFGDGQTLMSDEVMETYSERLANYIFSGYSEEEVAETVLDEVLHDMVTDRVLEAHARELGVYEPDADDLAEIEAEATQDYEQRIADCLEYQINTEGLSDEEATGAAKAWLQENEGVTLDGLKAELERDWWRHKLYDKLTEGVDVTDADVRAAYDAQLAEQKQRFTEYPDEYEFSQMNGETLLYNLPGYRAVKMLLLGFDDLEAEMAVFSLNDGFAQLDGEAEDVDEAQRQAELDSYYAGPEARAQQALEQLRSGADMDELIATLGSDPGMMDENQRASGYYVSADSLLWPEAFVQAAMALENVGDYSEPVRMDEGVCILQYIGDAPEGEVPLEDVREELREETLGAARETAYTEQTQAWLEEADPHYYPERMQ